MSFLYYKVPEDSMVGGVGIFIRNCYSVQEINQFGVDSSQVCKV